MLELRVTRGFWSDTGTRADHGVVTDKDRAQKKKEAVGEEGRPRKAVIKGDKFDIINQTAMGKSQTQRHGYESIYGTQICKYQWGIDRVFK